MKRVLSSPTSPTPLRTRSNPPSLSAIRSSSSLSSGSLVSYPVTTASFVSSPDLSNSDSDSQDSPDYLEPFEYTSDMEPDFQRIDAEAESSEGSGPSSSSNIESHGASLLPPTHTDSPPSTRVNSPPQTRVDSPPPAHVNSPPPTVRRNQKTWVVFQGREPGIYDCMVLASFQTQGFSGNYQRTYPDRKSADAAWSAYMRDGSFPEYGRPPWVIFIGRSVGVTTRVTELESAVKNYKGAVFRSCSSVAEGNIKLQLFIQHVTKLFESTDPFSEASTLVTWGDSPAEGDHLQGESLVRTATPTLTPRERHPRTPQVTGFPGPARLDHEPSITSSFCMCRHHFGTPHPSEGWYVAYRATVPGIYQGFKAFNEAGARPGGFQCAPDEESAKSMYLELATNGMIVWAGMEEHSDRVDI